MAGPRTTRGDADVRLGDALTTLLEPVIVATGIELEAVDVRTMGRRRSLKVIVDADGGVSLDAVAAASSAVSAALDSSDVMGDEPYVLEVSSPGVDRPLREPRHWRRAVGRRVSADVATGDTLTGRIISVDESAATAVLTTARGERTIALGDVLRAVVQLDFSRVDPVAGAGDDAAETVTAAGDTTEEG